MPTVKKPRASRSGPGRPQLWLLVGLGVVLVVAVGLLATTVDHAA